MKNKCDYLVLDITNLLFRSYYVQRDQPIEIISGMAILNIMNSVKKLYDEFKPTKLVMAFDRYSWRKDYTASAECISKKKYKGNRRIDQTEAQQQKYQEFKEHIKQFEELITHHTTIITLEADKLEADDIIAGFCQMYHKDNSIIVISADSDLSQLLQYENVNVITPATYKTHLLEKYEDDPLFYLFQKCIRGDPTDNITSAYPRVRSKRLLECYNDPYLMTNLLNERWTDVNGDVYLVNDLFKENQLLIDLSKQPEYIKQLMTTTILDGMSIQKKFSLFHILKYLGSLNLQKMVQQIDKFIPVLSL